MSKRPPFQTFGQIIRSRILFALKQAERPLNAFELTDAVRGVHAEQIAVQLAVLQRDGKIAQDGGKWAIA